MVLSHFTFFKKSFFFKIVFNVNLDLQHGFQIQKQVSYFSRRRYWELLLRIQYNLMISVNVNSKIEKSIESSHWIVCSQFLMVHMYLSKIWLFRKQTRILEKIVFLNNLYIKKLLNTFYQVFCNPCMLSIKLFLILCHND